MTDILDVPNFVLVETLPDKITQEKSLLVPISDENLMDTIKSTIEPQLSNVIHQNRHEMPHTVSWHKMLDHLTAMGLEKIGAGRYSYVYSSPSLNGKVLKVLGADQGYRAFINIIKEMEEGPHLPKIHYFNEFSNNSAIVLIEELFPYKGSTEEEKQIYPLTLKFPDKSEISTISWDIVFYYMFCGKYWNNDDKRNRIIGEYIEEVLMKTTFVQTMKELISRTKKKFPQAWPDLHHGNIMRRGDKTKGDLVIIDPYTWIG